MLVFLKKRKSMLFPKNSPHKHIRIQGCFENIVPVHSTNRVIIPNHWKKTTIQKNNAEFPAPKVFSKFFGIRNLHSTISYSSSVSTFSIGYWTHFEFSVCRGTCYVLDPIEEFEDEHKYLLEDVSGFSLLYIFHPYCC